MACLQIITQDNLELGCTIIEKAATDKAIREIDERLIGAFQASWQHSDHSRHMQVQALAASSACLLANYAERLGVC